MSNSTPSNAIKKLHLSYSMADVCFEVQSESGYLERIPSHKLLLASCSEVFSSMLNNKDIKIDTIKLDHVSPTILKEFLRFFYFDEVILSSDTALGVINLAKKYKIINRCNAYAQYLTKTLSIENVCFAYRISKALEESGLQKLCEDKMILNAREIFHTTGFLNCDRHTLNNILGLKSLTSACSEMDVFKGCIDWVRVANKQGGLNKEAILAHLGESFYDVRLAFMSARQRYLILSSYENLFTDKKRAEIIAVNEHEAPVLSERDKRLYKCPYYKGWIMPRDEPRYLSGDDLTFFNMNRVSF